MTARQSSSRWADTTAPASATRKTASSHLAGRRAVRRVTLDLYAEQSDTLARLARSAGVPQASLLRALVELAATDKRVGQRATEVAQQQLAERWSTP